MSIFVSVWGTWALLRVQPKRLAAAMRNTTIARGFHRVDDDRAQILQIKFAVNDHSEDQRVKHTVMTAASVGVTIPKAIPERMKSGVRSAQKAFRVATTFSLNVAFL